MVADIFRAKKERRQPSKKQQRQEDVEFQQFRFCWDILRVNQDGLLTISQAADTCHQERECVVCLRALHWELIWHTHKQAHVEVSRVTECLQLNNSRRATADTAVRDLPG